MLTAEQVRSRLWLKIGKPPRYTQLQLAREIGVSPQFLGDVLHGRREPTGEVLECLGLERVVSYRPKQIRSLGVRS